MKKLLTLAIAAVAILSSCDKKPSTDEMAAQAMQEATQQELVVAISDRDSLLVLVNEISSDMDQIKRLENILDVSNASGETPSQRAQIRADISAIQMTLEQRRQQLADLEKKLNNSNLSNSKLRQTIESLRGQIDSQAAEIETLRTSLDQANTQIGQLNTKVDSLHNTVDTVSAQRDAALDDNRSLTNELNLCYYVAASSKELKAHKILESGFLRKTKIMKGDFDQSFFTVADKRTFKVLNLHSKKAKVLTNQPADSYQIVEINGQKALQIVDPEKFWSLSNYLVIEID